MVASTDSQGVEEACNALLLATSGIRRKLRARLDQRLERSDLLGAAAGNGAADALLRMARDVHPDLEVLARRIGRVLALGPDALSAKHLGLLAQAGLPRMAGRIGGLVQQRTVTARLSATVRERPISAVLLAAAGGYAIARLLRSPA